MKKFFNATAAFFTLLVAAAPLSGAITASASTVSDVIAAAQAVGIPSQYIQEGINTYGGGNYTSEQCDQAIASIYSYQGRVDELLEDYFGVESGTPTTKPSDSQPQTPSKTDDKNNNDTSSSNPSSVGEGNNNSDNKSNASCSSNNNSNSGSNRPSDSAFIGMTFDEKIDYISKLPNDEKTEFIKNMTTEERNSFIKQLPMDDKASILNEFLKVGNAVGINLSVDEMSDDSIVISARDANGKLIDVSNMGNSIQNTGKPYTLPIVISAGLIAVAFGGIALTINSTKSKNKINKV